MSIFQSVKEFVTARQAAEQYGVKVNRNIIYTVCSKET